MRVLVVSNCYPAVDHQGGIFVKQQIEDLEKQSVNIERVVRTRLVLWTYLPFWIKTILGLMLKRHDLIHAHFGMYAAILPSVFKRRPLVTTFHGSDVLIDPWRNKLYYWLQRVVVSRSDYIIAVSTQVKDVLIKNNIHLIK